MSRWLFPRWFPNPFRQLSLSLSLEISLTVLSVTGLDSNEDMAGSVRENPPRPRFTELPSLPILINSFRFVLELYWIKTGTKALLWKSEPACGGILAADLSSEDSHSIPAGCLSLSLSYEVRRRLLLFIFMEFCSSSTTRSLSSLSHLYLPVTYIIIYIYVGLWVIELWGLSSSSWW